MSRKRPATAELATTGGILHEERDEDHVDRVRLRMCYRGLNVQPTFAESITSGLKTVERRKYPLGSRGTTALTLCFSLSVKVNRSSR